MTLSRQETNRLAPGENKPASQALLLYSFSADSVSASPPDAAGEPASISSSGVLASVPGGGFGVSLWPQPAINSPAERNRAKQPILKRIWKSSCYFAEYGFSFSSSFPDAVIPPLTPRRFPRSQSNDNDASIRNEWLPEIMSGCLRCLTRQAPAQGRFQHWQHLGGRQRISPDRRYHIVHWRGHSTCPSVPRATV